MPLKSISYVEFEGLANTWQLTPTEFGPINLIVGRNATGKSRVLHVISNFCKVIAGTNQRPFLAVTYDAEIELLEGLYRYQVQCRDFTVATEHLELNGVPLIERATSGKGSIWYEGQKTTIQFELDPSAYALATKRDKLQHPFAVSLGEWAAGASLYEFGTDLGRPRVFTPDTVPLAGSPLQANPPTPFHAYVDAFARFGDTFDKAVIRDMGRVGYQLSDVSIAPIERMHLPPEVGQAVLALHATEADLNLSISQLLMSQGMYRALALIVLLNRATFSNTQTLVAVDDIGEGLDYERASALIDVAIDHARRSGIQLFMTTNDRFVMNKVPLEHWVILDRNKGVVRAHTPKTSPKVFEEFKFTGLSNFDFFAAGKYQ